MNCKLGDLAIVRGTCPLENIRGHIAVCAEWVGALDGYSDIWRIEWSGAPQADDFGKAHDGGFIPDRWLMPISGVPVDEVRRDEVTA